jgi:DNA-binding NarL/FixJ family response regulator
MSHTASALIVDDHQLFRGGLKLLLQDAAGMEKVLEAGSLDEVQAAIASGLAPDLVTFDLTMPGLSGLEGLSALVEALPTSPVVVVSASEAREDILGALRAGAHGYIPKSLSAAEVADAVAQALAGQIYVPRALQKSAKEIVGQTAPAPTMPLNGFPLTARQRDVVELLLTGAPTRKIANRLGLAEGTVKIHLAAIYRVLGVNSRAEVIAKLK